MDAAGGSIQEMQAQQQQQAQYEEKRQHILEQVLEPAAKERLSRLSIVKKEKVRAVEESLIAAATSGKLAGRVTDEQLVAMLAQGEGGESVMGGKKGGVVVQRRRYGMDEDEDDDSDLL